MIRNNRLRQGILLGGLVLGLSAAGCNKKDTPAPPNAGPPVLAIEPVRAGDPNPAPQTGSPMSFEQSFNEAVITEVLEGYHLPPDVTIGGKKTGPMRVAVEEQWSSIKLLDSNSKLIAHTVKLETSEGDVEIAIRSDLAPNHARNFLALAKLGFYEGLQFERNCHQEANLDGQKTRLDLLIGGCPTGTGDDGYGHIGYFVRAEFRQDVKHQEGTVGFWHEEDPDSAGCRFYITLGPAPVLDGRYTVIGQVSSGLEVLKRIAAQPVKNADSSSPDNEKPVQPVAIKKTSIASDTPK